MQPDTEVVIETRSLSKVYRDFWGRQKVRALKALDLEVRRGEVFGLLGPNGSGKTTTIKLILGLLFPTSGQALVFGRDATEVTKNERIGYLPEESYLYRFLNAEETLDFYGRLFNMPRAVRRQRVADLIEMVGLDWAKRRQLKEYSKGMTRRIGLAQALINDPELIVLDEPTTGLDPIGTREMKDLIIRLRDEGKTILMCSHLLADVQDVCDRIAILYQGELKEMGRVDSLLKVRDVTEIRAAGLSAMAQEEVKQVIERNNGHVLNIGNPTTTLEELFLKIIRESQEHPGRRVRGVARQLTDRSSPLLVPSSSSLTPAVFHASRKLTTSCRSGPGCRRPCSIGCSLRHAWRSGSSSWPGWWGRCVTAPARPRGKRGRCCPTRPSIWGESRRGACGRWPGWRSRSRSAAAWWSVFAVFILLLLFAGWFLDPGSEDPARLYLSFVLTATSYLVLLLALILSSLSLPADIRNRTLHTVVTKPVRASEVVLGRIVGFTAVGTLLLAVMGAISYGFVVRGLAHTHQLNADDLQPAEAAAAGQPAVLRGYTSRDNGHRHKVTVELGRPRPSSRWRRALALVDHGKAGRQDDLPCWSRRRDVDGPRARLREARVSRRAGGKVARRA